MIRFLMFFLVLMFCICCSPFSGLRKRNFSVAGSEGRHELQLLVPKRYAKKEAVRDSGSLGDYYRYSNGAYLYIIQTTDTATLFQPIDTANNVPLPHPSGGVMYKGLDSSGRFWREVRTDSFRFGYRFVPPASEILFDSAVNYAGALRFKN